MIDNKIVLPTVYGEGFHRGDFEGEQEPALAIACGYVRWAPRLFSFSSKDTPIVVEKIDVWDLEWQSRFNSQAARQSCLLVSGVRRRISRVTLMIYRNPFLCGFVLVRFSSEFL